MTTAQMKDWIDKASYEDLLRKRRFSGTNNDNFFFGEAGDYFKEKMAGLKKGISHEEHTRISKKIGWER